MPACFHGVVHFDMHVREPSKKRCVRLAMVDTRYPRGRGERCSSSMARSAVRPTRGCRRGSPRGRNTSDQPQRQDACTIWEVTPVSWMRVCRMRSCEVISFACDRRPRGASSTTTRTTERAATPPHTSACAGSWTSTRASASMRACISIGGLSAEHVASRAATGSSAATATDSRSFGFLPSETRVHVRSLLVHLPRTGRRDEQQSQTPHRAAPSGSANT